MPPKGIWVTNWIPLDVCGKSTLRSLENTGLSPLNSSSKRARRYTKIPVKMFREAKERKALFGAHSLWRDSLFSLDIAGEGLGPVSK